MVLLLFVKPDQIIVYLEFVLNLSLSAAVAGVIWLRFKEPNLERPYKCARISINSDSLSNYGFLYYLEIIRNSSNRITMGTWDCSSRYCILLFSKKK